MSVNERLADAAVGHAVDLAQYGNGVTRRMLRLLDRVDADLVAQIQSALERLPADSFTVQRLEAQLGAVRELNRSAYEQVGRALPVELAELTQYEAQYQQQLFTRTLPNQVVGAVGVNGVNIGQVQAAAMSRPFQGRLLSEWAQSIEAGRMTRIRDSIRMGYAENQTIDQMVRRIRGTRANNYADGLLEIDRRHAEAVVRTAVSHTASYARHEFYAANSDLIAAELWDSTLDLRTTDICIARSGLKYTLEGKPIGHSVPYLSGPGASHWNAIAAGSEVQTKNGPVPIEVIKAGDMVLTHCGRFQPVLNARSKANERGVICVAYTEAGRILRATYEHPVLTSAGWRFMGALEVGDELLGHGESLGCVRKVGEPINAKAKDRPACRDGAVIALFGSFQFVPADIDLKGDFDFWASKIEDYCIGFVLANPTGAALDQCAEHHLFATAHSLKKLGRNRLGDFLSDFNRDRAAAQPHSLRRIVTSLMVCLSGALSNARHSRGVIAQHSLRMARVSIGGLFRQPVSPVAFARRGDDCSVAVSQEGLLLLVPNGEADASGVTGKSPISEPMAPLYRTKGCADVDVLIDDELPERVIQRFCHDRIIALAMQDYSGNVYDIEVKGDASYVASGVVVSNCRSVGTPVTKSWRELGVDVDEFSPSTRASMDGEVPADLNYKNWLTKQSADRQDEVLGVKRGRLLREGKLEIDRFFNDKGRMLSLEELRQRDAKAFKRAGL